MRLPLDTSARAVPSAVARLVNVQAEQNPPDASTPARIMHAPGVRAYRSGHGVGRGLHVMGGSLYSIEGTGLYRDGELIGNIPGSDPVSMTDNGATLLTSGGYYTTGGAVSQITDLNFPGASVVDFIDGYFVFLEPSSARFWVTELYSVTIDPLKFATAEGSPDALVDLIVDTREVVLFGTNSLERYYNAGADNFPLERSPQGFSEIGCLGGVAKLDNSIFWVANDQTVRRLTGSTPQRVSTHAVEERIRGLSGRPRAFSYALEGHLVYVCSWDDATLCYDATTATWFERQSYDGERWRACATAIVGDTVYVQDRDTGAVGILDADARTEWGAPVVTEWTYPAAYDGHRRLFHSRLELICGMGAGGVVMLEASDDGGKTWRFLPSRPLGATGAFRNRATWWRLGSARQRVYRMSISDAVPVNIWDTRLDVG